MVCALIVAGIVLLFVFLQELLVKTLMELWEPMREQVVMDIAPQELMCLLL